MNIELRNIHKWFGKVHANDDISLKITSGTIQGILGENGAGKSTLMKILSGFIHADSGEILLDGNLVKIKSPDDAIRLGIGMLHQDPLDFPPMRVIDNFLLGQHGGLFLNRTQVEKQIRELSQKFGFQINPDAYVETLTVGERQQLEILRLLWMGVRILILDEPTTGISANQKEKLFATLVTLAKQGLTVIFVSHKLEDVQGLCDRVAVFRQGKVAGELTPPYNTDEFIQLMFDKEIKIGERTTACRPEPLLRLENIGIEDYRLRLRNINLTLYRGEILGLAGMEGSGQKLFLQMLAGIKRPVCGKIMINDVNYAGKRYENFLKAGISYIPASRMEEGLIPGLTLTEHFILSEEHNELLISQKEALNLTQSRINDFRIKGVPYSKVEQLSGGNQQRALLALMREKLNLILMEHPTRGLDIESSIWIWKKMKERCADCTSIVFISADLEEIIQYSDRILVFFGGMVSEPIDANTTSVDELGQLIGGIGW